jgi:copper resistance protein C
MASAILGARASQSIGKHDIVIGPFSNSPEVHLKPMPMKRVLVSALAVCALLLIPRLALAHAHLLSSTPAANAAVHGPEVAIELRFNSRVDARHSVLTLVASDGHTEALTTDNENGESNLNAHATLKPGSYMLRWQALSTDGHITRGEIPFSVR